jgi:hypothetical protein
MGYLFSRTAPIALCAVGSIDGQFNPIYCTRQFNRFLLTGNLTRSIVLGNLTVFY